MINGTMCVGLKLSLSRAMPFSLNAMFLILTCGIPATIAVCEDSSVNVEEGQTAELSYINRRFSMQEIFHWYSNKKLRYVAEIHNNRVYDINKPEKLQMTTNSSHIIITIRNVSIDDSGLYIVFGLWEKTLEVVRLSVEGTDDVTDVDTVITRRGSTVRFPVNYRLECYIRPTDTSYKGEDFNSKHYTRIRCPHSIIANKEQEGCYVMFEIFHPRIIYIQRIQLSDIEITVRSDGISCEENPLVSGLPFRLEHQYNGSTIRHVENNGTASLILPLFPFRKNDVYQCISYTDFNKSTVSQKKSIKYFDSDIVMNDYTVNCYERSQNPTIYVRLEHLFIDTPVRYTEANGNETVQLPLFPISFHNNGIYTCIFYINKEKSAISETKSLSFAYKGLPVFAEENRNELQGELGRSLSMKVLVYSNPNITGIKVIGENRSTDNFIIHDISTQPTSLNGWNGTTENIPGWEINIDIMFEIQQNITLWINVENAIGNNKFKIIANIKNPTTPEVSGQTSFISVATCILAVLLLCIITLMTVHCVIIKNRRPTTVEIERSPYVYDEIGTIDYRVTNIPPPIRDVALPGITRRMELSRAEVFGNISDDRISIRTQEGTHRDAITHVDTVDTTETRRYLSLPCSVRPSDTNNEEEIIPTFEIDNENEIESVIEPQKSAFSSNKIKMLANEEHNNEIQFPLDQLVADININKHSVIEDSDSSNSDVPLAAVEPETQNNLYEAVSSNIRPEHVYNQCENSSDPETQTVPKEYI